MIISDIRNFLTIKIFCSQILFVDVVIENIIWEQLIYSFIHCIDWNVWLFRNKQVYYATLTSYNKIITTSEKPQINKLVKLIERKAVYLEQNIPEKRWNNTLIIIIITDRISHFTMSHFTFISTLIFIRFVRNGFKRLTSKWCKI